VLVFMDDGVSDSEGVTIGALPIYQARNPSLYDCSAVAQCTVQLVIFNAGQNGLIEKVARPTRLRANDASTKTSKT
jgi:hypothetical protein